MVSDDAFVVAAAAVAAVAVAVVVAVAALVLWKDLRVLMT